MRDEPRGKPLPTRRSSPHLRRHNAHRGRCGDGHGSPHASYDFSMIVAGAVADNVGSASHQRWLELESCAYVVHVQPLQLVDRLLDLRVVVTGG
jgi:hypothetical protein